MGPPTVPAIGPLRVPANAVSMSTTTLSMAANLGNDLPSEILHNIFSYLSHPALTRVVLVSRRWHTDAERLLYSSIVIKEVLPRSSTPELKGAHAMPAVPAMTLRCCETLSLHPHLVDYVRRFHIRWQTDAVESPALLLLIAQNIARSLVPTLRNLASLDLSFGLADSVPPRAITTTTTTTTTSVAPFLPPFQLPYLRSLALHGIGEPPEHLLRNHPKLLDLKLGDYRRPLRLTPADVPRLRSFRGHPATAASVLPGRPIEALGLVGSDPASDADLARIASGSLPVRSLDLSGMSVTPTALRNMSRHFSKVELLKVRLALRHTLHYALSGIRLLTALTTVLSDFGSLRDLDISPTSAVHHAASAASDDQNAFEEQRLCVAWSRACPLLCRVVFPSGTEWSLAEGGTWSCKSSFNSSSPAVSPSPRDLIDRL